MQHGRNQTRGPNGYFWAWLGILVALFLALGPPSWVLWVAFLYLLVFPLLWFLH
jgi:hypothetical protein